MSDRERLSQGDNLAWLAMQRLEFMASGSQPNEGGLQ